MREKENQRAAEEEEQRLYDQQTLELTKYRGVLEYDFLQKKNQKHLDMISANLAKDGERRAEEERQRLARLEEERERVELLNRRGQKVDFAQV